MSVSSVPSAGSRRSAVIAGILAGAALLFVFLLPSQLLLSSPGTDLIGNYVSARAFSTRTLLSGHLPLWNPYTYAGEPFVGGFESAVFYPPNLIFLCLPLARALNFSMLVHLIILGWGMERWASRRALHPWAALLAGFIAPLSGAVFPHLYAGHLSNLCTMAWAPWIFLGLEDWTRHGRRRGLFLASAAICLQILAGHIQYFFYTAVAAGIQAIVASVHPVWRWRALPAVAGCYLAALALSAVQFFPGLAASAEGIRQQKLDYAFASMFSFPPENFLTLLAPGFFGNVGMPVYWGRCYLWEMSLFIGTASPLLIAIALGARVCRRLVCLDLIVAGLLLVLALGAHTPLFDLLYAYAPGFGHFRGWAKFTFPATLFLILAIAQGVDHLLAGGNFSRRIAWGGVAAGLVAGAAGLFLLGQPEEIATLFNLVSRSGESYLPTSAFDNSSLIHAGGIHAGLSLGLAGLVLTVAGGILLLFRESLLWRAAIPVLVAMEMVGFAAGQLATSHVENAAPAGLRQFVAAHPGDYRVLNLAEPDNGFLLGASDMWGNNPSVLRRYAEFMTFTQGRNPDQATQYVTFKGINPLYSMLRFRYAFVPTAGGVKLIESTAPPLPRLLLVSGWKAPGGRNAIFSAMQDISFEPAETVLLESDPKPTPEPDATGSARLVSETPDVLTIEADTDKPTLLLITDLYARDWRAEALLGSVQSTYHLMPADYVLRAIPLRAGHHRLRVVYAPISFPVGLGVSAVAWILWIGFFLFLVRAVRRPQFP